MHHFKVAAPWLSSCLAHAISLLLFVLKQLKHSEGHAQHLHHTLLLPPVKPPCCPGKPTPPPPLRSVAPSQHPPASLLPCAGKPSSELPTGSLSQRLPHAHSPDGLSFTAATVLGFQDIMLCPLLSCTCMSHVPLLCPLLLHPMPWMTSQLQLAT